MKEKKINYNQIPKVDENQDPKVDENQDPKVDENQDTKVDENQDPKVDENQDTKVDENQDPKVDENSNNNQPKPGGAVVSNCKRLNIRTKPNTDSEILCIVNAGDTLTIKAIHNGWARVITDDGTTGFAMEEFIEEV